jgi:hypothetical protein
MQISLKNRVERVKRDLEKDVAPDALKLRIIVSSVKYSYYEICTTDAKIEYTFCIIAANQK